MNRVSIAVILLLIAFVINAGAQETTPEKQVNKYSYWTAKLPLLNFIDVTCPNLQLGAERRLDKHNAVQLIAGISADGFQSDKPKGASILNGYRFKGEYRRYFLVRRNFAFYGAAGGFYNNYRHYTSDSFVSALSGLNYYDKFYVHKSMWGAEVKCGLQRMMGQRWMFEFFAGLGFKSKTVTQTDRTAPSDMNVQHRVTYLNISAMANQLGTYTTITLPMNLTIGYKFR